MVSRQLKVALHCLTDLRMLRRQVHAMIGLWFMSMKGARKSRLLHLSLSPVRSLLESVRAIEEVRMECCVEPDAEHVSLFI